MGKKDLKQNPQARPESSRRKFLGAATAATTGAAMAGFPAIARAQATQFKWKLQSANPAGTPHMELLTRLAANIDAMSGGRLKIEVLTSGAIVAPFEILDGVNKGIVEAGQWWTH